MWQADEYKAETLREIRKINGTLVKIDDQELSYLYQLWSEINYCAGWVTFNDKIIQEFCKWATTPPYLYS